MRKAIIIGKESKKESKGIEFTHYLSISSGWTGINQKMPNLNKVVYLGKCDADGDMFAGYFTSGSITVYKGFLNDGTY